MKDKWEELKRYIENEKNQALTCDSDLDIYLDILEQMENLESEGDGEICKEEVYKIDVIINNCPNKDMKKRDWVIEKCTSENAANEEAIKELSLQYKVPPSQIIIDKTTRIEEYH